MYQKNLTHKYKVEYKPLFKIKKKISKPKNFSNIYENFTRKKKMK